MNWTEVRPAFGDLSEVTEGCVVCQDRAVAVAINWSNSGCGPYVSLCGQCMGAVAVFAIKEHIAEKGEFQAIEKEGMPTNAAILGAITKGVREAFDQLWASQISDAIADGVKQAFEGR